MAMQHLAPVRAPNPDVLLVARVSTKESYGEAAANVVVEDRSIVDVTTMGLYIDLATIHNWWPWERCLKLAA